MKKIFLLLFFLIQAPVFAQEEELKAISHTVNLYFEGMVERNFEKLEQAFHPEARLIGYRGESFTITPFETWAKGTSSGSPRDPKEFKNSIKSIRVEGYTAVVETELYWPGIYYFDFLTLIKFEGKWKIVNKSWFERPLE
jgi:hypothetical protein